MCSSIHGSQSTACTTDELPMWRLWPSNARRWDRANAAGSAGVGTVSSQSGGGVGCVPSVACAVGVVVGRAQVRGLAYVREEALTWTFTRIAHCVVVTQVGILRV